AKDIIRYAEANNFSHLIIGRTKRSRLHELLFGSVTSEIVRSAGNIAVHVISGDEHAAPASKTYATRTAPEGVDVTPFLASGSIIATAIVFGELLSRVLEVQNVALVLLTAVLVCAVAYGLWPALFASALSVLAVNFFFLPPLYTFTISDPENIVALFFFLVVAFIASNLTANVRSQAMVARRRAKTTEDLYLFSRKLAGIASLDDLLWVTASQVASMLKVSVVLFLPESGSIALRAAWPPEDVAEEADLAAAKWS